MSRNNEESADEAIEKKFKRLYKRKDGTYKSIYGHDVESREPCGEASPYADYLARKGSFNQESDATEPSFANPDQLDSADALWEPSRLSHKQDAQWAALKPHLKGLTLLQQRVVQLVGLEGRSLENAAAQLGITKSSVQTVLERLRKKFKGVIR